MSAIASATSPLYSPVVPVKNNAQVNPAQSAATQTATPAVITPTTRNSDGTYGPNHLRFKPGTQPVQQQAQTVSQNAVTGVDIKA